MGRAKNFTFAAKFLAALNPEYGVRMKNRTAFTLIELLVVISIIAVLMGIMMPALSRARDQAKTVVCGTRLHNVALSFSVYAEDYKSVPLCWNYDTKHSWHNLLLQHKYVSKESLFCPSVKLDPTRVSPSPETDISYYYGHYAMNYYLGGTYGRYGGSLVDRKPLKLYQKTRNVILVADIRESCDQGGYVYMQKPYFNDVSFAYRYATRHGGNKTEIDYNVGFATRSSASGRPIKTGGSANYMFADMHLENTKDWEKFKDSSYWEGTK